MHKSMHVERWRGRVRRMLVCVFENVFVLVKVYEVVVFLPLVRPLDKRSRSGVGQREKK